MKRAYILSAIGVAIAVGLAVSEVRAVDSFPTEPLTAPRECTTPDGAVRIVAGPGADGNPTAEFPRVVTCPGVDCLGSDEWTPPLVGQYLIWEYEFTHSVNPSHALLSVSSDMEIAQAFPSAWIGLPGEGDARLGENMYESRILRFNANSTTYRARYFTELGIGKRNATGGYQSGKKQAYCAIAGAGTEVLEPGQAIAETQCFVLPGADCTVCYIVDSRGRVVVGSMVVVEGDCTIEETTVPIEIDGNPVENPSSFGYMTLGSCRYCWVNSYGGESCCRCDGCCIKKGTSKCIRANTAEKCLKCKDGSKPSPCPYL